jgi:crotonobetainyl-CoA:carnitine CoA-transferase CaiB-like acyl-CoA transferase
MADLATHLRKQMPRYELAQDERLERAKARLAELEKAEGGPSMSNTKAELLAAAEEAGVEVAEDATKRQILEALDG